MLSETGQHIRRLTPPGSANTCGWFHPEDSNIVMFASTVGPPSDGTPPGYHRKANKYKWMFPPEMRIFQADISDIDNIKTTLLVGDEDAYQAEGYPDRSELTVDPFVEATGDEPRALRGGSWYDNPRYCRSAARDRGGPRTRSNRIGFRVARDAQK